MLQGCICANLEPARNAENNYDLVIILTTWSGKAVFTSNLLKALVNSALLSGLEGVTKRTAV